MRRMQGAGDEVVLGGRDRREENNMGKRSWLARLLVGGLVAGGLLVSQAPPSTAGDCIYVVAYITRENQDPYFVWDDCVLPTDWNSSFEPWVKDERPGIVPTGTPNGFYVQVFIPMP